MAAAATPAGAAAGAAAVGCYGDLECLFPGWCVWCGGEGIVAVRVGRACDRCSDTCRSGGGEGIVAVRVGRVGGRCSDPYCYREGSRVGLGRVEGGAVARAARRQGWAVGRAAAASAAPSAAAAWDVSCVAREVGLV